MRAKAIAELMTCHSERARSEGWRDADAVHECAAVGTQRGGADFGGGRVLAGGGSRFLDRMICGGELAAEFESFGAVSPDQEAVVTDAREAAGEDLQQKAAHELLRLKPHDLPAPVAPIVLVGERDLVVADGYEP